jgi:hypothetical protein
VEVVTLAFPPPARFTVASTVIPAVKVTVPVGVTVADATVALNVTGLPSLEGFTEETTVVVVPDLCTDSELIRND